MPPLRQDKTAKPKVGRYYPYAANELILRVNQLAFSVFAQSNELRPAVILENCEVECSLGYQLCSFLRQHYIAHFSMPLAIHVGLSRKATDIALHELRKIDAGPWLTVRAQQFVVYRAYLRLPQTLSVTRHVVNGQSRSYLKMRKAAQLSKAGRDPENQSIVFETHIS